jgi:hypothetical protein
VPNLLSAALIERVYPYHLICDKTQRQTIFEIMKRCVAICCSDLVCLAACNAAVSFFFM